VLPAISCLCLTYGRPKELLEEAVYSFVNQDYQGEKELLVLNDFGPQVLYCHHPQVTMINLPVRFRTLGEKRNAAVGLCQHDLVAIWDDDDIYLPHRLSFSVAKYVEAKRYFKPTRALLLNNGQVNGTETNLFHSSGMWHRSLFKEVGGYTAMDAGEDAVLEQRFRDLVGPDLEYTDIRLDEIYYLYRWSGSGSYHISGFQQEKRGREYQMVREHAYRELEAGRIRAGELVLRPHWKADYTAMARAYIDSMAEAAR
jgi:hypothetical protein